MRLALRIQRPDQHWPSPPTLAEAEGKHFWKSIWPTRADFEGDRANPFLFSHYLKLPEAEYPELTRAVMDDRERLYRHLIAQNYGMGLVLARKFQLLRWSCNGFVTGLAISTVLLVAALFSGSDPA